jgi:hypothetical protein
LIERLKARCTASGHPIAHAILTHEAGRNGLWLARYLVRRDVEVHVMQPSSLPVDRRARRAKTDVIDVEMLLRTLMAWLGVSLASVRWFQFRMKPTKKRTGPSRTEGFDRRTTSDREQDRRHSDDTGREGLSGVEW